MSVCLSRNEKGQKDDEPLLGRMHLLRQHLLKPLRNGFLCDLWHGRVARGVAHTGIVCGFGQVAGVVDGVGDFLFDFLGELLLELLGDDAVADGVGLIGTLRHVGIED